MTLDRFALIAVSVVAGIWVIIMLTGAIAAWPFGIVILAVLGVVGYLFVGVLRQRLANAEDDYYDRNVER